MSGKTNEVPQLADATYAHTLVIHDKDFPSSGIASFALPTDMGHHANFKYILYLENF